MAFVNTVDFCVEKNGEDVYIVKVTDTTGVYNGTTNLTGWEHASTLLASAVTEASIIITNPSGATLTTDVLTDTTYYDAPITGEFEFDDIDFFGDDGIYKVEYIVTDGVTIYTACKEKLVYPAAACCITEIIERYIDDTSKKYLTDAIMEAKAIESAMVQAAKIVDHTSVANFLALLQDLCNYSESIDC